MSYTYKALALIWLIVFSLVGLSGSGMVVGSWVLLLVGAALVMPALISTLCPKLRSTVSATTTSQERALATPDVRDRSAREPSGIDVYRWENEGGARRTA